jgi:hypothetical protein
MESKSKQSHLAFEVLYEKELYASSIHCIYYHCLQLSKYVLCVYCGIDYDEQKKEGGNTSHDYVRKKIMDDLLSATPDYASSDFGRYFNRLKKLRVRADYSIQGISKSDASSARGLAKCLNNILIDQYINK